jgi:hypothetical protein
MFILANAVNKKEDLSFRVVLSGILLKEKPGKPDLLNFIVDFNI